jgi:hypothetical protein
MLMRTLAISAKRNGISQKAGSEVSRASRSLRNSVGFVN